MVQFILSFTIGEQAWPALPPDSDLSINKWWGSDAISMGTDKVKCEVEELTEEEVPIGIANVFNRDPDRKAFTGGTEGNLVILYYKIDRSNSFKINIESLSWSMSYNGTYSCYLITHKELVDIPTYKEEPYYYLRINLSLLHDNALANKYLVFDDQLNWKLSGFNSTQIK